jgi:hypothetical protein
MIQTYTQQLTTLATIERVNLYDAVRHAGLSRWTASRIIKGETPLRKETAEAIHNAIKDLSAK